MLSYVILSRVIYKKNVLLISLPVLIIWVHDYVSYNNNNKSDDDLGCHKRGPVMYGLQ